MGKFRTACPADCQDSCSVIATIENGRLIKTEGDPEHPITRGWLCRKGRSFPERVYHPERLLYPQRRTPGGWRRITWEEAFCLIEDKLTEIKEKWGTTAVLHYYDSGSSGVLKALVKRFFNAYGGTTRVKGSLCWGAGIAAQAYDFGRNLSHDLTDIANARTVVAWGRDVPKTNQHAWPFILENLKKGGQLVVINPVGTEMHSHASLIVRPKPGTDGALALAVAHVLVEEQKYRQDFVEDHVYGFAEFTAHIDKYTPSWAAAVCDIPEESIYRLAQVYGTEGPVCTLLGYGLQRYANGGNTVRTIDAVAALSGNIGIEGGGVNYGSDYLWGLEDRLAGEELAVNTRCLNRTRLTVEAEKLGDPPLKAMFVNGSNVLNQGPNRNKMEALMRDLEFIVVTDHFLTDTAKTAHLVLPATTFYEEKNIYVSSWQNWIYYGEALLEPRGEVKSDQEIFLTLAKRMGLPGFPYQTEEQWLKYYLEPLMRYGVTIERLKEGPVRIPYASPVAFADKKFPTGSGRFELFSRQAAQDGQHPMATYFPACEVGLEKEGYPLHLITAHAKDCLNSQFSNLSSIREKLGAPALQIHPEAAKERGIAQGDKVEVRTPRGVLTVNAVLEEEMRPDTVVLPTGWWKEDGGSVNYLTEEYSSEMGSTAAYYDCRCQVRKAR